jgi:hypothetical protein
MHAYVKRFDYTGVGNWKTTSVGFCMHSDWVWGYFINFFHISVHSDTPNVFANVLEDRLRGYNDSELYAGKQTPAVKAKMKVCWNEIGQCQASSPICHYMTPDATQWTNSMMLLVSLHLISFGNSDDTSPFDNIDIGTTDLV